MEIFSGKCIFFSASVQHGVLIWKPQTENPLLGTGAQERMNDMAEMNPQTPQKSTGKLKQMLSGKKIRRWIVLCVAAVTVIGGAAAFMSRAKAKAAKVETTYTTASVEKRSITNSLTGSGTLQPADSYTVTTLVSGEVLSDTFEEGDMVEKDQLLYTIDSSDVSTTESQAQTSYSQALKAKYPTADISGTVSEVYVSNGDAVNAGTELMKISASNDLTIDFQFSYANDGDFYVDGAYVKSRKALEKWSRYQIKTEKGNGTGHIVKTFSYDTTSKSELCNRAVASLQKICDVNVTYEISLYKLPQNAEIGDTIYIIDNVGKLWLSARLLRLEVSECSDSVTIELGEYKKQDSGIDQKVIELAEQFEKVAKNRNFYTWTAYADDESGNGISLESTGKAYLGIATNQLTKEANISNPTQYTWAKIKGEQGPQGLQGLQGEKGEQGIPGPTGEKGATGATGPQGPAGKDGTNGKTSYFHIKYSSVENPTSSQMSEIPNTYIGTYVDYTELDSTDPSKYTWYRFQGLQGTQGTQGIPGTNGADGKTSYLHIKYSNDGGKTFTSNAGETVGDYIGQCTDFNKDDPTTVGAYTWSKIKGETGATGAKGDTGATGPQGPQGVKGDTGPQGPQGQTGAPGKDGISPTVSVSKSGNATTISITDKDGTHTQTVKDGTNGTPGTPGSDGRTPYIHVKYSDDGGKTFTSNSGETVGAYIGICTDYNVSDPGSVSSYTWAKIKGDKGDPGSTGKDAIIISSTAPTSPKTGQLWQIASGEPIKRWDGSKWVLHYISVENLDVQKLSAIAADLGTVTAGVIKNKAETVIFDVERGVFESWDTKTPQSAKMSAGTFEVSAKDSSDSYVKTYLKYYGLCICQINKSYGYSIEMEELGGDLLVSKLINNGRGNETVSLFKNLKRTPVAGSKVVTITKGKNYVKLMTASEAAGLLGIADGTGGAVSLAVSNGDANVFRARIYGAEYWNTDSSWYVYFNVTASITQSVRVNYILAPII